jgi:hypothetical protein
MILANRPCLTCQRDRLHRGLTCMECGTATVLAPIARESKSAANLAKARAARLSTRPQSQTASAVRSRAVRAAMKARGEKRCG